MDHHPSPSHDTIITQRREMLPGTMEKLKKLTHNSSQQANECIEVND